MVSRKGAGAWPEVHNRQQNSRTSGWLGPVVAVAIGASVLMAPSRVAAQAGQPGAVPGATKHEEGALLANYPNPFSPATRIPFSVGNPPACSDPGRRYHVTLKVYNLLAQPVAIPVIIDASANSAPIGQQVQELQLACGQYTAYWDGIGMATNRPVASGLYLYRLEINGKPVAARKMLIRR
jgi:hypothetical protein